MLNGALVLKVLTCFVAGHGGTAVGIPRQCVLCNQRCREAAARGGLEYFEFRVPATSERIRVLVAKARSKGNN